MLRLRVTPTPEGYEATGVLMSAGTHACGEKRFASTSK